MNETDNPLKRVVHTQKTSLLELTQDELTQQLVALDQPAYRARQIWEWAYKNYAPDFADMSNLPKALRQELENHLALRTLNPVAQVLSAWGATSQQAKSLSKSSTLPTIWPPQIYRQR